MEFEEAVQRLKYSIHQPLPGKEAQMRMSPRPVNRSRFDPQLPPNHRKGAVLILIYPQDGQAYFPLIKRPEYPGVHSGQVAFPGGKMEEEDESLIITALREAQEEVSIDPAKVEILGKITDLFVPASNFLVSPIVGISHEIPDFVPEIREVQRIIPTQVSQLISPEIIQTTILEIHDQIKLDTPYFEIDQEIVWGATAMILGEFIQLLKKGK